MSKTTGLGARFFLDGYDLSGDVGSLSRINTARNVTEVTGIDVLAPERLHTHGDGGMEWSTWINTSAGRSFPVLRVLPSADRIATYCMSAALGAPAASCVCKQVNFDPNRGTDASLSATVAVESNGYGVEWGNQLTAGKRTDTAATNGASFDFAAGTSFGLQAYLQVFDFTGTSVTVKLQQSSDNGAGDAWADVTGGGFTVVSSAPAKERIQTARDQAVERYLRVVTTGTFSNAVFAVNVVKNKIETNF